MSHDRRLALVTGASSGIGEALARRLARDGHDLIVVARRGDRLTALAESLTSETGAEVEVLVADLTAPDDVQRLEKRVAGERRLDLLVNNAGFAGYGPFVEIDPVVAERLVAVHVLAPVRITRAALPGMIARGHGAVVNVASLLALSGPLKIGMAARATYAGAKSFLLAFTQSLAGELEGTGVHAMVCLPGMVESEFHGIRRSSVPGLQVMSSEDVAQAIVVGLRLGEVVCAPGVDDLGLFDQLRDLQQAILAGGARTAELTARYRQG